MSSPQQLIGNGIIFPLNINSKGTLQLDTGWPILRTSLNHMLAYIIGQRYFLGEFGASIEDLIEEPNDDITQTILQHRLQTQLPYWDQRIQVDSVQIQRDNDTGVNIMVSISLKNTDLTQTVVIPITEFTVQ